MSNSVEPRCNSNLITARETAPSAPVTGDIWFDTTTDEWKRWDGTAWIVATEPPTP
jgi:hypothetical protein